MKKYMLYILLFLCFMPVLFQISEEKQKIETKNMEMDRFLKDQKETSLFGILEIPTLSLKQPVYKKESAENEVDKNVTLLEETITKKDQNHVIVLASHSGEGIHSYFKNLSYLKPGNLIHFYYQNFKNSYELFKKQEVLKTGTITLDRYEFPHIILITCSKTKNDLQEVYYAKKV